MLITGGKADVGAVGSPMIGEMFDVDVTMKVVGVNSAKEANHPFSGSCIRCDVNTRPCSTHAHTHS